MDICKNPLEGARILEERGVIYEIILLYELRIFGVSGGTPLCEGRATARSRRIGWGRIWSDTWVCVLGKGEGVWG